MKTGLSKSPDAEVQKKPIHIVFPSADHYLTAEYTRINEEVEAASGISLSLRALALLGMLMLQTAYLLA